VTETPVNSMALFYNSYDTSSSLMAKYLEQLIQLEQETKEMNYDPQSPVDIVSTKSKTSLNSVKWRSAPSALCNPSILYILSSIRQEYL
jgi:putative SOS response-associated peptidase YedK